jgi:hypothetical protein
MSMIGPFTTSPAAGGAGVAAGSVVTNVPIQGYIAGFDIQYNDAPPAGTTDVGIKTKGLANVLPSRNLLTITNAATDGYFVPQVATVKSDNTATGGYVIHYVSDYIQIDMAGANNGDSVSVWLYVIK